MKESKTQRTDIEAEASTNRESKSQDPIGDEPNEGNLSIFDERFALFTDHFGSTCETEGVATALVIVIDPVQDNKPIVYYRGNIYDVTLVTKMVLDNLRNQILSNIT